MSAVGLDLEERVNLGGWQPEGRVSSHLRIYSAGPVQGFHTGQSLQGKRNREDPGRYCSWDIIESGRKANGVRTNRW